MCSPARLAACLADDSAAGRTRPARWKSLLASLTLQTALVAVALLVPLLAGGDGPVFRASKPILFPAGDPKGSLPARSSSQPDSVVAAGPRKPHLVTVLRQPPVIPSGIRESAGGPGGEAPSIAGPPWGVPHGTATAGTDVIVAGPVLLIPEPQPPAPKVVRISRMEPGALLERVEPVYPQLAKQMGLEGTVVLRARIGTDGRVRAVEVESGHPLLAGAAKAAVLAWRYRPTLLNGQPVEVETRVVVNFQLRR